MQKEYILYSSYMYEKEYMQKVKEKELNYSFGPCFTISAVLGLNFPLLPPFHLARILLGPQLSPFRNKNPLPGSSQNPQSQTLNLQGARRRRALQRHSAGAACVAAGRRRARRAAAASRRPRGSKPGRGSRRLGAPLQPQRLSAEQAQCVGVAGSLTQGTGRATLWPVRLWACRRGRLDAEPPSPSADA